MSPRSDASRKRAPERFDARPSTTDQFTSAKFSRIAEVCGRPGHDMAPLLFLSGEFAE